MSFLKMLDRPPREYTPVPFWFLNGDLSHEEIRRQLRDFCDHGVYGAVLHPRMGLREDIGYLSESFFGYMRTAIETAAELSVNGQLCGVSFWPPHHFRVPAAYTRDGAAELRLTVTGSPANRYGKPVPYGLKQETACP